MKVRAEAGAGIEICAEAETVVEARFGRELQVMVALRDEILKIAPASREAKRESCDQSEPA